MEEEKNGGMPASKENSAGRKPYYKKKYHNGYHSKKKTHYNAQKQNDTDTDDNIIVINESVPDDESAESAIFSEVKEIIENTEKTETSEFKRDNHERNKGFDRNKHTGAHTKSPRDFKNERVQKSDDENSHNTEPENETPAEEKPNEKNEFRGRNTKRERFTHNKNNHGDDRIKSEQNSGAADVNDTAVESEGTSVSPVQSSGSNTFSVYGKGEIINETPPGYVIDTVKENDENVSSEDISLIPRIEVVGVRFKQTGKVYYFDPCGISCPDNSAVIVETARGIEYATIAMPNREVKETEIVPPLRPVIRLATAEDIEHYKENERKEIEAFNICVQKIAEHNLAMKLIDAEYTFDNSKLLFYFSHEGRVDFRELVKDLASVFRTRIELRQIGIRDEAKMMGGLGVCGRPFCCHAFLGDFVQVSIKMAKEQSLSLNSQKISGSCGRLMCCLRYEYDTYAEEIRRTPPVDSIVDTPDGEGIVTEIAPLAGTVKVRLAKDSMVKSYARDTLKVKGYIRRDDADTDKKSENNSDGDVIPEE